MADTSSDTMVADAQTTQALAETPVETPEFIYPVTVENAGASAKKVTVGIPGTRIASAIADQYKELKGQATVPGFRPGRVPARLIQKKFSKEVREQVTRNLLQESYQQAIDKNQLKVLGDPDFGSDAKLELPDTGDFNYSFNVEVFPEFIIPDLTQITVKKPKISITDEHVAQALLNLREQQGVLLPVENRGAKENDIVAADVHVKIGDETILHQHDQQIRVRSGGVLGITVDALVATLEGAKVDDIRTATVTAPQDHPTEKIRGQEVLVEFKIKDLRELELAEINDDFLEQLGFKDQEELLQALRDEMENRVKNDVQNTLRDQVAKALLEQTSVELPVKLSVRQEIEIVQRRGMDLLQRGVPEAQIRENLALLQAGATEEANRELKTLFIMTKIADDQKIEVTERELNANIAAIAEQRGMRPEALKKQMETQGSLQSLYIRLREVKTLDKILEQVKVEEVEPETKA
jgi:trigger factor